MIWEKIDIDNREVRMISEKYRVDPLIASILVRRDIKSTGDIKYFLEDDFRFLYNPFLFKEMEDVIDRLHLAIEEEEKVLVFGDKDVDGVTSSVILYEALKSLGIDVSWKVPTGEDSYGLSVDAVEKAYEKDISLIITVDCGISAFESIKRAREIGIDVIIFDHHNPRTGSLPDATYIINPKLEDSGYPFNGLAACGVVSKVLWALCFSKIETLYKSSVCILHTHIAGDDIHLTCTKLYNLVEQRRVSYSLSNSNNTDLKNIIDFLQGEQILIYDIPGQAGNLAKIFGTGVDINGIDIKSEVERILPGVRNIPPSELITLSKMRVYSDGDFSESDLIVNLFITYVERRYKDNFNLFFSSLDLVALGTVADLMPIRGENRILVKNGLKTLSSTRREGLQALLLKQNLIGKEITSRDISWNLAPILNSAGRMKRADKAVEMLLCEDRDLKNKLTLDILQLNKERRTLSESLWSNLYSEMHDSYTEFNNKLVYIYNKDMVKGVTGIIASRALSTFSAPCIVVAREGDFAIGSIRSNGNLDIELLFKECDSELIDWGGHKCAAGFKLVFSRLKKFRSIVERLIRSGKLISKQSSDDKSIKVDADIPHKYLTPDIINVYDRFEPFGEANPPLNLATRKVSIIDISFMGKGEKNHLKLLLEIGDHKWPAIYWNAAERAGRDFTKGDKVDILYRVERNFYGGNETLQLVLLDIIK